MNSDPLSTSTRRAVIYLRVSTVKQASGGETGEGFSIPAQRQACLVEAERHDAEV